MGRPWIYTREIADAVCAQMAEGKSLRSICRAEGMPSEAAVRRWAIEDVDGFAAHYARAREDQAHAIAEEIIEIADDGRNDWMAAQDDGGGEAWRLNGEHVQRSRLRADSRRWLLSKMLPKVYGERLELDATVRAQVVTAEPLNEDEWINSHKS